MAFGVSPVSNCHAPDLGYRGFFHVVTEYLRRIKEEAFAVSEFRKKFKKGLPIMGAEILDSGFSFSFLAFSSNPSYYFFSQASERAGS